MKKSLSFILVLVTLFISGCSSNTDSEEQNIGRQVHKISALANTKIERANWDGVVELVNGFSITNDNELLSFKIQSPRIADETATHHIIFIDSDNNPITGYLNTRWDAELGAEYMIEGNILYRYAGTGWRWTFVSRIDINVNPNLGADELELEFSLGLIDTVGAIRATTYLINNNWNIIQQYNSVNYSVENIPTNNNFTITDDATTITFNIQSQRVENGTATGNAIFIDTDNDPTTGYNNTRWQAQLGAEYMIDSNTLFMHGGNGWNWTSVANLERVINNDILTIVVNKNNINNLSQTIRATSYLIDNQWRVMERFDTLSHINEDIQLPVDNGTLSIAHNINNFIITIENDEISDESHTEVYLDADNNSNTGFRVNGIGAEYRVIDSILSRYRRDTRVWVEAVGVRRVVVGHSVIIRIPRWRAVTRRNISISSTVLDAENNILHRYNPISYEVRGDDDEITLSLDEPDLYIFTIHSPLIGVDAFGDAGGGEVRSLHMAIDTDMSRGTGNFMNDVGAEYYIGTWDGAVNRYVGPRNTDWWTRFEQGEASRDVVSIGNHTVELRVPRELIESSGGIINVASTFNNVSGHFYWTNRYEFNVNP